MDKTIEKQEYLNQIDVLQTMIKKVDPDNAIYIKSYNDLEKFKEHILAAEQSPAEKEKQGIKK